MTNIFEPVSLQIKVNAPKKRERNIQKLAIQFIENPTDMNFTYLVKRITWGLRSYIYKIVKNDEYTDIVMSQTLESIYFKRHMFNPEIAKFSTWMYRIARNNAIRFMSDGEYRNLSIVSTDISDLYESTVVDDNDSDSNTSTLPSSNIEDIDILYKNNKYITYTKESILSEMYDASIDCIDYLPDNLRIVMRDRLLYNKKINDIAEDNNIPITSVKNWLRKGKIALEETVKLRYHDLYYIYKESLITA